MSMGNPVLVGNHYVGVKIISSGKSMRLEISVVVVNQYVINAQTL